MKPSKEETLDQAPAGIPKTKIIYEWNNTDSFYATKHCYSRNRENWREFSCDDAYR